LAGPLAKGIASFTWASLLVVSARPAARPFELNRGSLPVGSILLLLVGVFCCATSVLMIKASQLHPALLSAYRLLLSAALLFPLYVQNLRKHRGEFPVRNFRLTFLPATLLAFHFITWTQGAQWTHAANATLIVCMVPVVMPFLLYATMRETITMTEVVGTAMALGGAVWLTASDFWVSRQTLMGDITCFVSMLFFAFYLVQARANRDFPSIWLYVVPLYAAAGVTCFLMAFFVVRPMTLPAPREFLIIAGLALVPTILGHSILNHAMRHLRGQTVSVVNLFQFVFAGALAFLLYGEVPRPVFYAAGALVVAGAIIVIHAMAATAEGERAAGDASNPEV
jgi:drug/metabolite transporter (DMT)-like permease